MINTGHYDQHLTGNSVKSMGPFGSLLKYLAQLQKPSECQANVTQPTTDTPMTKSTKLSLACYRRSLSFAALKQFALNFLHLPNATTFKGQLSMFPET